MQNTITIERARIADREEMLSLLSEAFSEEFKIDFDFQRTHAYLFTPARISNHLLARKGDSLAGIVGLYPYEALVNGVVFKAIGVGQVAVSPDHQRQGIMTTLMKRSNAELSDYDVDFSFLWGEHYRYARFGYSDGGRIETFSVYRKYLPRPEPNWAIRDFDPKQDCGLVSQAVEQGGYGLKLEQEESFMLLSLPTVHGLVLNNSFILFRDSSDTFCFASGDPDELAKLFAFKIKELRESDSETYKLEIEMPALPNPALNCMYRYYWLYRSSVSAMFRAGRMAALLEKIIAVAADTIPCGSDELSIKNTDSGEIISLRAKDGKIDLSNSSNSAPYALDTEEFSRLCFGPFVPQYLLDKLKPSSPFQALFPLKVHIPKLFML